MRSRNVKSRRNDERPAWLKNVGNALISERTRFVVLGCFMLLVALTGGSSRPDIPALILLRPAAVLFAVYALLVASRDDLHDVRGPLLFILTLGSLALLQLVPLPATIWSSLPNRGPIAELSALTGNEGMARPLSLDPNRTWNTLFAWFTPLAAVCLAAIQAPRYRDKVVPALMLVAFLSAMLGLLQAIGGNGLHFYAITHRDFPVGLFANKNHQAVMLLWLMLAACWMTTTIDSRRFSASVVIGSALGLILVLFPLLILAGSRAALLLAPCTLILCAWLLFRAPAAQAIKKRAGKRARLLVGGALVALAAPLLFVFAVLAVSGRKTALSRLFELDAAGDLRWQYTPVILRMVRDFMPLGSGFGSFEKVFNIYEPENMLSAYYMNQAHNDVLQVAIEGGAPVLAILVAASVWWLYRCWRLWRSALPGGRAHAAFFAGSLLLWLGASVVDYPLRTPLAAMVVAALTVQLCFLSSDRRSGSDVVPGAGAKSVSPSAE